MAVYKRTYKGYTGSLTAPWSRFLILPRFAWAGLFQNRFLTIFYALCFFYPLGCLLTIYLNSNLQFIGQFMKVPEGGILEIGNKFFFYLTNVQGSLAFLLTCFIGPGLISPDLVNNALPLYFCRPFTRTEYVAGKMAALAVLLSWITWVPGLLLFGVQASLADKAWLDKNLWIAGSILAANLIWILLISLVALAISAWVRWKIVAGALMLVVFFLGAGLGAAINQAMNTTRGSWLDIGANITRVWWELFDIEMPLGRDTIPNQEAWASLILFCAVALWLLWKKVRAYEVVG